MAEEQNQPVDDALIGRYLSGEANPAEAERVRQWLVDADPADRQRAGQMAKIWHLSGQLNDATPVNTDAAWAKVRAQMQPADTTVSGETSSRSVGRPLTVTPGWSSRKLYGRVAAVMLLAGFTGLAVWQLRRGNAPAATPVTVATLTAKRTLTLPDGSRVTLNRNSRLTYPATFADSSRVVSLTGEAFFDVVPDSAHPFRIGAGQTTVRVLGTSFGVRAVGDSVRVTVQTGRVRFSAPRQTVVLTLNQQATYHTSADTLRRVLRPTPNALAFQTGRLVFDNEPLAGVIQTLREVYGADIRLAPTLRTCRYTARFDKESLDAVLSVLAETFSVNIRRDTGQILLDGTACP